MTDAANCNEALAAFMSDPSMGGTKTPNGFTKEECFRAGWDSRQPEVDGLVTEANHWRANHLTEVRRARILKERPDLPFERVAAYQSYMDCVVAVGTFAMETATVKDELSKAKERLEQLDRLRDRMKDQAGFDQNVSFDVVWGKMLSCWKDHGKEYK